MLQTRAATFDKDEFIRLAKNPSFRDEEKPRWVQSTEHVQDDIITLTGVKYHIIDNVQPATPDSLALNFIIPDTAFSINQNIFTYPIFSLPNCSLKHPIEITVETDEAGNVIIWSDDFELSGIGETKEDALEEFSALLISDYNSLKKIPSKNLSEGAKELLYKYAQYLG